MKYLLICLLFCWTGICYADNPKTLSGGFSGIVETENNRVLDLELIFFSRISLDKDGNWKIVNDILWLEYSRHISVKWNDIKRYPGQFVQDTNFTEHGKYVSKTHQIKRSLLTIYYKKKIVSQQTMPVYVP